jgi:nucleoside 2-deoxyribosyltransferase
MVKTITESLGEGMDAHQEFNVNTDTGALRDGGKKPRLDLISPHLGPRLGEWLRFACEDRKPKPYPARNWERGLSFTQTVGSLERHIAKFKLGDTSEDHVAAMLFNAMVLAHQQEEIAAGRLPKSLDDMPHYLSQRTYFDDAEPFNFDDSSRPFTVYLCGPITGESIDHQWRNKARRTLAHYGIDCLDPLRGKAPEAISEQGMYYEGTPASVEMADRDVLDVETADLVFAHFPYTPKRQSIGSLMELGIAATLRKDIVLCAEKGTEFNTHLFIRRFCILEPNFDEALETIVEYARMETY